MTRSNFEAIKEAAREAVDALAFDDLENCDIDPDEIDTLATDGSWEWADLYGPAGARVFIEEFCAAAWEKLGL